MATYTNLTDVNISSSVVGPLANYDAANMAVCAAAQHYITVGNITTANVGTLAATTAALTTTNITGKANIVGAVTGIKSSIAYTWTNTNANFSEVVNVLAQVVSVIRGLT